MPWQRQTRAARNRNASCAALSQAMRRKRSIRFPRPAMLPLQDVYPTDAQWRHAPRWRRLNIPRALPITFWTQQC
ncbi:hypothetical protein XANMN_09425 [Xanthomonas phaseoli pv. manihotis str. CIO151]|nr:hypothetical protein XANMN_09425 [Xanthomonas phaseoli pv. manihotis str. CIO151]